MPLIGLTTYNSKTAEGSPIVALSTHYVRAVIQAGGTPVLLPSQLSKKEWMDIYRRLDGILFTGGGDIALEYFGGQPHPAIDGVDEERDTLELALARAAAEDGKPFLGICRGLQVVNVALGGTLYTHISDQLPGALNHDWHKGYPRSHPAHPVRLDEDSQFGKVSGEAVLAVNSLHHQGLKYLAPGLQAVAFAPDGLVEAVELSGHRFGLAVQWHPEWLTDTQAARRLFAAFIEAAGQK